ncbi:MAG: IS481 family transposase, partial [Thermoanaerobaculia bacterium]|nr:IS481 family transposase [Thermoanaerobaculia bacterium]
LLNHATIAWVEREYNHGVHSETGTTPYDRFLNSPNVGRPPRSSDELRRALRMEQRRTQRRSDGTISVEGKRFELPSRYRTLLRPTIRYARWDLSTVDLVDARTGALLCSLLPLDKQRNADARRRTVEPLADASARVVDQPPQSSIAPLLTKLMADYAATGLPPAYLPHFTQTQTEDPDE